MSPHISLQRRVIDYLAERRRLGFELRSRDTLLAGFARYVADQKHRGPLNADLMIEWARHDKWHHDGCKKRMRNQNCEVECARPIVMSIRH